MVDVIKQTTQKYLFRILYCTLAIKTTESRTKCCTLICEHENFGLYFAPFIGGCMHPNAIRIIIESIPAVGLTTQNRLLLQECFLQMYLSRVSILQLPFLIISAINQNLFVIVPCHNDRRIEEIHRNGAHLRLFSIGNGFGRQAYKSLKFT